MLRLKAQRSSKMGNSDRPGEEAIESTPQTSDPQGFPWTAFESRLQLSFSRSSCARSAAVSEENFAARPVSVSLHLARIHPCCTCNTGFEIC
jgi:hypothetical protein